MASSVVPKARQLHGGILPLLSFAALLLGCAVSAPSSPPALAPSSTPIPETAAPTSTPSATEPPIQLDGRLYFGRFDVAIGDMTVWTADGDGADPRQLVPGAHYIVCVNGTTDEVVMAGPDASGLLVLSTVGLDGEGYRELPSPDGHLNFGVGTCLPDGRVAVEAWDNDDPTRAGMYMVDLSGEAGPVRITKPPAGETDIPGCVLADDGIAFLRAGIENEPGILHLVRPDGTDERQVGDDQYKTGPACSDDGRTLLAESDSRLFLVDVDGSRTEIMSSAPEFKARKYGATFGLGDTIAFSLLEPGPFHDLYAMRLDGTGLTRLTHNPEVDNESPRWVSD